MILGNSALPHRNATRSFAEGIGWISQIGLFVMLGMMARPELLTGQMVVESLIIGTFLTFVARPLSVFLCSVWFKVPWREQAFISWAGLRGAVPMLVFVIVFTLVQGPSLPWVARKLGIVDDAAALDIEVEVAPLDRIQADFMQVKVPEGSKLHGVTIGELRLPRFTVISVIVRDGHPLVPSPLDRIQAGDELMVVVPSASRVLTEKRFRDVGRHGRLARWLRQ